MEELITIIINVYNGEKFVKKCLDSIINQTYKNLEILIINDGSTDNTLSVCESYNDERIRIITTINMGLSLSRNVGIENAKGVYLYFVDSDDWIELDTIEYLYNLCKKYNTKMSTCRPIDVYDYDCIVNNQLEKVNIIYNKEMLKKILLTVDRAGTIWNKLIKKELFNNIRFEDRIINDVVVIYKLILVADQITYSNQIKYYYLRHRNSITGKNKEDRSIDLYKAAIERYKYIKKIYPDFIENEIGLLQIIRFLYLNNGEKLKTFLKEQKVIKLYKKLFSINMLISKISFKEKVKIVFFKIGPKLYKVIAAKYNKNKKSQLY